ncbi:MAG: PAS domain S-box protein [Flavobacteriaceae bacterium]|nr:PAS domain S-box protein [Flavobacteriaceae bacterium]MDG1962887.1 PAS domain S-box protein [Flavobacteriaceae bacterium]
MSNSEIDILRRALAREKLAKQKAEKIVEDRIRTLYVDNLELSNELLKQEISSNHLLEDLIDAVVVIDLEGNILKINKAAYDLIDMADSNKLAHINDFQSVNSERLFKFINRLVKTEQSQAVLFPFTSQNGNFKIAKIKARILKSPDGEIAAIQTICHDVTEEEGLKKLAKENKRIDKLEKEIFQDILSKDNIFDIGWAMVNSMSQYLSSDDVIFYAHIENKLIQVASAAHKSAQNGTVDQPLVLNFGEGVVGGVAQSMVGRIIHDTSLVPEYIVDKERRFSSITIPIILEDQLIGIIDSEAIDKNHYNEEQFAFLTKIGSYIGLRIRNAVIQYENTLKDKKIQTSTERLQMIVENFNQAVVYEGTDGKIKYVNQKFLDLFDLDVSINDVVGMDCQYARSILSPKFESQNEFSPRVDAILEAQVPIDRELLFGKDGRMIERSYRPIINNSVLDGHLWSYVDNTIEHRFNANISFERQKYAQIIANMELGLLEVDNDDRILTANNAFCSMTQYLEHELIGKIGYEVLVSEPEAERIKTMNAKRIDGESNIYEIKYRTKNKEERYMLVSGGPNRDIKGNVIGSVGVHLDITKLKELEALREDLIKDLTASNDELSNYAHVVSHDLKTPLRSISAAMAWLKEDNTQNLDEMSFSYLEIVDDSLLKMEKIISDTLRYSELKKELAPEIMVDLNHLVNHLISDLKKIYPDSKIQIEGTLPQLLLNETKALQVFQNILDNACKYRDPNRASRVTVRCSEVLSFFEFEIQDNGIGIPEESAHHVFEIFQKLNNNADSNGIGLSIVKKIIESYGGKVSLESQVGQGTTFMIQLPQSMSGQG